MQVIVRNTSNQEEHTFYSWAEVGRYVIKNNTPRSEKTTREAIAKLGWEVIQVIDSNTSSSKTPFNVIDKLESILKVIDKDEIKRLDTQRDTIVKTAKTSKDFTAIIEINNKLEALQNPSVSLDAMLEYIKTKYNEKYTSEEA